MLSLHPLVDKQFLVKKGCNLENSEDNYYGRIPDGKEYKRCKAVIFQEFCPSTKLGYDVMISWLQKSIRRGLVDEALYVAIHLAEMKGIFLSNLLNRLMTILSEDIGPANPGLATVLYPLYKEIKEGRPQTGALREHETLSDRIKENICKITCLLAKSSKSRITDWIIFASKEGLKDVDETSEVKELEEDVDDKEDADEELEEKLDDEDDEELEDEDKESLKIYDEEDIENLISEFFYRIYDEKGKDIVKAMTVLSLINSLKVSQIRVKRSDGKVHAIWNFWDILLNHQSRRIGLGKEVKALYHLFDERDDILHLAHALTLVFYDRLLTSYCLVENLSEVNKYEWDKIYNSEIPVMNDAIDAHTRHGKKLLGRDLLFFLERGCKLVNHRKFPEEDEIYNRLLLQELAKKEEHLVKNPRGYQLDIVRNTIEYFDLYEEKEERRAEQEEMEEQKGEQEDNLETPKNLKDVEGCLHMACGTGKSLTSFWIVDNYIRKNSSEIPLRVLIVTPRLQVLSQFYRVYRDSLIYHKHKSVVGVMCSDFDRPKPHDLCYHLHLKTQEDLDEFYNSYLIMGSQNEDDNVGDNVEDDVDNKVKTLYKAIIMFTTYKSLDKIKEKTEETNGIWDIIIYDEAHHMKDNHRVVSKRRLLLSATPRVDQTIIASYTYKDAIEEESLVPYTLHVANLSISQNSPNNNNWKTHINRINPTTIIDNISFDSPNDYIQYHFNKGTCNKLIVFSSNNARSFKLYEECKERLEENGLEDLGVSVFYIDHKTRMKDREPIVKQWINSSKAIFFNCSILGEGVDFPSVDAIYIESGHISEKMVIQAAGRPLRLDPNNPDKVARIFMSFSDKKEYDDVVKRLTYI